MGQYRWHKVLKAQAGKHKPAWHTVIYSRVQDRPLGALSACDACAVAAPQVPVQQTGLHLHCNTSPRFSHSRHCMTHAASDTHSAVRKLEP